MIPEKLQRALSGASGRSSSGATSLVGENILRHAGDRLKSFIPTTEDEALTKLTTLNAPLSISNFAARTITGKDLVPGFREGVTTDPYGNSVTGTKYSPGANIPPMMF